MGWFSSLRSSVGSWVSSAASSVSNFVGSAYSKVKDVAGRAVDWMAEKAESFVGSVKSVWNTVRPYVDKIREGIRVAAQVIPIPWVSAALTALDKGLGALTNFENSPIARKINDAINWAINLAKRWKRQDRQENDLEDDLLSEHELSQARRHQENLRFAEREIDPSERHHLELASAINDYEIAKADLSKALAGEPADFEHYLRLRATQKLLKISDKKFRDADSVDDLSSDDLFLVRIASDLVKSNPELSKVAAQRLDRILTEKYGKTLQSFVFEELISSWGLRAKALEDQWIEKNKDYARNSMLLKRLQVAQKIQNELDPAEQAELDRLEKEVPEDRKKLDELDTRKRDLDRYVGAAEGFLQVLEKTEEEIEREDRAYLLDDGAEVGRLLCECAEHDRAFSDLTEDERGLISAYANVFKNEAKERMEAVMEMSA